MCGRSIESVCLEEVRCVLRREQEEAGKPVCVECYHSMIRAATSVIRLVKISGNHQVPCTVVFTKKI